MLPITFSRNQNREAAHHFLARKKMKLAATLFVILSTPGPADGFSSVLFHDTPTLQRTTPSKSAGVDIELPDFDELFDRIQQVSPLARDVIARAGTASEGGLGFASVDDTCKFLGSRFF